MAAYQHMSPPHPMPGRAPDYRPGHMAPNGHPPPPPHHETSLREHFYQTAKDSWLQLGFTSEKLQMNADAMDSYHHVLQYDKLNVHALRGIASILRSEDKYDQAVKYIESILQALPHDGESWSSLGHCYLMMDELQQAYSAYQSALYNLGDPKEPKLWYGIGILYDRYGSLDHAEEAFSQVMRMAPQFDKANEIYFRLGIIYKQQQKYEESLQCFKYIVDTPPTPLNQTDIWFQIGHVYEQQKKYEDAKDAYIEVLKRDDKHAKVLQQLGWLHHQQSQEYASQEQAIEYLEQSVSSDQTDAQSWYLLGRCYMSQHKFPKAYEAYQQAVYRDGRNPTFWCSIGVLYYQINQYRDALDAYSRAIRLNPNISEVWYDLGTLYESCNNQTVDALDAYERAAELDPTNIAIKSRLTLLRNGQGSGQPNGTTAPMPRDVPPQAYQPAGAGAPQQGPWGAAPLSQQHPPPPPPPPLQTRDWGGRGGDAHNPPPPQPPMPYQSHQHPQHGPPPAPSQIHSYDQRDGSRYPPHHPPPQRQPSPKSHAYTNHDSFRQYERRPLSPSPRTRPSVVESSRTSSMIHPPHSLLQSHQQPGPSRITNPNYGVQHVAPPTPSSAPMPAGPHSSAPLCAPTATPPNARRPEHDARPRSPRSYYPHPPPYPMPAEPSGPSNIANGAPPPLSATTAADAAARDRDRENGLQAKRPREWDSRDDLFSQNYKRPARDDDRVRLEEPLGRRIQSPNSASQYDRERVDHESGPPGAPRPYLPSQPSHRDDMRRADEEYRPSANAHQPAPLATVLQQDPKEPPHDSADIPLPRINDLSQANADAQSPKREEPEPQKMEVDDEEKPSEPAVKRPEEPAARKMEVDEDYDDESADDAKQNAAADGSGRESRASQWGAREPVSAAETNGMAAEPAGA